MDLPPRPGEYVRGPLEGRLIFALLARRLGDSLLDGASKIDHAALIACITDFLPSFDLGGSASWQTRISVALLALVA